MLALGNLPSNNYFAKKIHLIFWIFEENKLAVGEVS